VVKYLLAILRTLTPLAASVQSYPEDSIRLVVTTSTGGAYDIAHLRNCWRMGIQSGRPTCPAPRIS
jgi:hypothetical protein